MVADGVSSLCLLGLLGQKDSLDVGQDTSLGNGDTGKKLVQLLIVADGQLKVAGDDAGLLVVTGSIAGQLEDLSSQVLHDGGQVNGSSSSDAVGVVALAEHAMDAADEELKPGPRRSGLGLRLGLSSFASSGHVCSDEKSFDGS